MRRSWRGATGAGELTPVWVPDAEHEALRDLVRAREAAKRDQLRARHRLGKFLLRHGRRPPEGMKAWTPKHLLWVQTRGSSSRRRRRRSSTTWHEVEHVAERIARLEGRSTRRSRRLPAEMKAVIEALQALRGISQGVGGDHRRRGGSALALPAAQPADGLQRAGAARGLDGRAAVRRGAITKTGNAHLRRIVGEAAWAYRHRPAVRASCEAPGGAERGGEGDRLEGAAPAAHALSPAGRPRASRSRRSSPPSAASCWASSGPSGCRSSASSATRSTPVARVEPLRRSTRTGADWSRASSG